MASQKRLGSCPIVIPDGKIYTAEEFVLPSSYANYMKGVLIPGGCIRDRAEKMAYDIRKHYKQGELHIVCLLKGSRPFFATLSDFLMQQETFGSSGQRLEIFHHFVNINTYSNDGTTGQVKFTGVELTCLKGKDVLVVDDIVETGNTLNYVKEWLSKFEPKSVRTAGLLQVRIKGELPPVDFLGFTGPREWFVGFGIDYNDHFRGLPHLCVLGEQGKKAFSV